MTEADARHLLLRSGFAPAPAEVAALTGKSAQAAVNEIISTARAARPLHPAPGFVALPAPMPPRLLPTPAEKQAARQQQQREGMELKSWWLREMIETPAPLRERMTLFWHNHFATSMQKVYSSQAMWRQQELLRADAVGNFRDLLHGVAKDPAMLVYLDGARSRKGAPNENFAREVMELFTLGEASSGGNYTEQDVREAARAFTGWTVDRDDLGFSMQPRLHDDGMKTVLGQTGPFDGDAVLDIMLEQPAAAKFIVDKLWKEFVSPAPDRKEADRIALRFRQSGYDIGVALQGLFMSDAFWAESSRGTLVKSPVDLIVGTVRQFNFSYSDTTPFAVQSAQLGQNLLSPPNVKGWPGQDNWITTVTLMDRKRFTDQLFRTVERKGETAGVSAGNAMSTASMAPMAGPQRGRDGVMRVGQGVAAVGLDPDAWLSQYGAYTDREPAPTVKEKLAGALLASGPTQTIASGTVGIDYLRLLTLDPAYQLK
ncbi:MAG: DUF1800 domain-containing protein [Comamonadaceae bacterium]|nr:MAG: DUF1800 domain-containing protein [Comamonadaceae bacterium]